MSIHSPLTPKNITDAPPELTANSSRAWARGYNAAIEYVHSLALQPTFPLSNRFEVGERALVPGYSGSYPDHTRDVWGHVTDIEKRLEIRWVESLMFMPDGAEYAKAINPDVVSHGDDWRHADHDPEKKEQKMSNRYKHTATYYYPGSFMPETVSRVVSAPTFEAAEEEGPAETGYFCKDGWYAVIVRTIEEKRFVADDEEEVWVAQPPSYERSYIVGYMTHWTALDDSDENRILRSNIRSNSKDGYGVRTRCGNWQVSSDWDEVRSP